MLTSAEICEWVNRPAFHGRSVGHTARTWEPILYPDSCRHQPAELIITTEGDCFCWLCGCRPPKYLKVKPE